MREYSENLLREFLDTNISIRIQTKTSCRGQGVLSRLSLSQYLGQKHEDLKAQTLQCPSKPQPQEGREHQRPVAL